MLAALPDRTLVEDQYLAAALVLDAVVATVLARTPDRHPVETEFFCDEYPQYQSDVLSKALARSRKFKMTCHFFAQGYFQSARLLFDNLLGNTAVKVFGATDHPDESGRAGKVVHRSAPNETAARWMKRQRRGRITLETVFESEAEWAQAVRDLPNRVFVTKVRGHDAVIVRSVDIDLPLSLRQALELVHLNRVAPLISPAAADAELAWREQWIRAGGYGTTWPGYGDWLAAQVAEAAAAQKGRGRTRPAPARGKAPEPVLPASTVAAIEAMDDPWADGVDGSSFGTLRGG